MADELKAYVYVLGVLGALLILELLDGGLVVDPYRHGLAHAQLQLVCHSFVPSTPRPACDAEMNSAFSILSNTPVCFLHNHRAAKPAMLQRSVWTSYDIVPSTFRWNCKYFDILKYCTIRFAVLQSFFVGMSVCLVTVCTAKQSSGREHHAINSRLSIRDWNDFTLGSPFAPLVGR